MPAHRRRRRLPAWLVNYHFTNGFFKVAAFLAITVPSASVIMFIDHFLLPRWFGISRPLVKIPAWSETALVQLACADRALRRRLLRSLGERIVPGEDPTRLWESHRWRRGCSEA